MKKTKGKALTAEQRITRLERALTRAVKSLKAEIRYVAAQERKVVYVGGDRGNP